jgi:NAD(P)-dependent dehydrogenase (short-subunit alcohol dehydrogenase family)
MEPRVTPVQDLLRLDGRIAVVSGASRNIGMEISRALCSVGAHVVMVARDADRLRAAGEDVAGTTGGLVTTRVCDVSRTENAGDLVDWLTSEFGQVDVLVNNAHATGDRTAPVLEVAADDWAATLGTNLLAPYQLCAGLIPAMISGRGGSVINMLTGAAFRPASRAMAYGASKAALWSMTQYLAKECAPKVRVNALVPGFVLSDSGGPSGADLLPRYLPEIALGRVGRPDEIAPAVVFLASDAASYMTGSIMWVNGGRPSS